MNYQYIEQLLERYWECQTTLEEEAILTAFFAQEDVPASLLPYRDLFLAEADMAQDGLGDDFDKKLMGKIAAKESRQNREAEQETATVAKIVRMTPTQRLRPFYRAAAVVAVVLTIGMAAQQGFERNEAYETGNEALTSVTDSIELFTEQPELSPQTEAVLAAPQQADTMKVIAP